MNEFIPSRNDEIKLAAATAVSAPAPRAEELRTSVALPGVAEPFGPYIPKISSVPVTPRVYGALQVACDHAVRELFGGKLPPVFITLRAHGHTLGHFAPNRYRDRQSDGAHYHEVALNPDRFPGTSDKDIFSTLVHELVHELQQITGKPGRRGYHNRQFAELMKPVGLYPSDTGKEGGRETGEHMDHYVIPGGPFEQSFERLYASGWRLHLESAGSASDGADVGDVGGAARKKRKITYRCQGDCGDIVYGNKMGLEIACMLCTRARGRQIQFIADASAEAAPIATE